jgi:peptidoglycan-N-acetylglucosamine deacetylase
VARGVGPAGSIVTTGSDAVALTFDDGPWPEYTPEILDLLKANNVKATFCVIGKQAQAYPALIQRIHDEGHSFCNHSWRHDLDLRLRTEAEIRDDLAATSRAIRDAVPDAQIGYFRAPGGNFDTRLVSISKSMGMTPLYWYIDTRDWEFTKYGYGASMVDNIVTRVKRDTRKGSIILSHDKAKPDTVTAYQSLLPWLKQRFQLIALPPDGRLPRP